MASELLSDPPVAAATEIPRIVHRVWLGDAPLPEEAARFGDAWRALHPGWEVRLWTDADLPPLRNQALYDASTVAAQRADIVRYELLERYGGVYVDTDVEPLKALDPLLADVDAFVGAECDSFVGNAVLGATAGHPFFAGLIEDLPRHVAARAGRPVNEQTGPVMLTERIAAAAAAGQRVPHVFAASVFYPYSHREPHRRHEAFPDAFAVHHWAMSWLPAPDAAAAVHARFAVQLDWDTPLSMVALARAYAATFPPEDAVELAFVVPGEATAEHVEQVRTLMDSVADAPGRYADAVVYGEDELAALRLDAAVTRPATDVRAGVEVAESIAHMQRMRDALHPAPAPPPVASDGGGVHGTYVGDGRVLVGTRWGGKLCVPAGDRSLTPYLVTEGTYDVPFTSYLQRALRPGGVVFDVGANVGLFTVLMAQLVGPDGRVVAYEAVPENAAYLRENLAMNWIGPSVTVVEAAAADASGAATFSLVPGFSMIGSLDDQSHRSPLGAPTSFDVALEPLDDRLAAFDRVDLVKIDVEGAENRVLRGMRDALERGVVRAITLELRTDATSAAAWTDLSAILRGLGADGWAASVLDDRGAAHPIGIDAALAHGCLPQLLLERG